MSSLSTIDLLDDIQRLAEAGEALANDVDCYVERGTRLGVLLKALSDYRARVAPIVTAGSGFRYGYAPASCWCATTANKDANWPPHGKPVQMADGSWIGWEEYVKREQHRKAERRGGFTC